MEQFLSNVMTKERYISVAIVIIGAIIYVISINLIKNFYKIFISTFLKISFLGLENLEKFLFIKKKLLFQV